MQLPCQMQPKCASITSVCYLGLPTVFDAAYCALAYCKTRSTLPRLKQYRQSIQERHQDLLMLPLDYQRRS